MLWLCVILPVLQLSSSVQFYDRSRLPYQSRPESHKRNTCKPSSVSCNLCRSILPYRQVLRVTNTYVLSFCLSSSLSVVIIRLILSMESELPAFLILKSTAIPTQSGGAREKWESERMNRLKTVRRTRRCTVGARKAACRMRKRKPLIRGVLQKSTMSAP